MKFTVNFYKIGYFGTKRIVDKLKVNYSRVFIFQAYDLKERLEELELNIYGVTIASVGAINMYPSTKLATVKKAVRFVARKLTVATKKTINLCLELTQFMMNSTLISFNIEYYK